MSFLSILKFLDLLDTIRKISIDLRASNSYASKSFVILTTSKKHIWNPTTGEILAEMATDNV